MGEQDISGIYESWVAAVNGQNWQVALSLLQPEMVHNDRQSSNEEFLHRYREQATHKVSFATQVEVLLTDYSGSKLAVRLLHTATPGATVDEATKSSQQIEWTEQMICVFKDGKIAEVHSISDAEASQSSGSSGQTAPLLKTSEPKNHVEVETMYRHYIDAINSGSSQQRLEQYCQPQVTHNSRSMTLDQYQRLIESSFEDIKGLHFSIEDLVIDEQAQRLGARLGFTGQPVNQFMGIEPTGNEVVFSELAFYQLDSGKIVRVWSLLDLVAYRESIAHSK